MFSFLKKKQVEIDYCISQLDELMSVIKKLDARKFYVEINIKTISDITGDIVCSFNTNNTRLHTKNTAEELQECLNKIARHTADMTLRNKP